MTVYFNSDKFTKISNNIIDDFNLDHYDIMVFLALCKHMDNKTKQCWPSRKTLAKYARVCDSTLTRCLNHLEELGYITVERRLVENTNSKASNLYTIHPERAYHEADSNTSDYKKSKNAVRSIEETEDREVETIFMKEDSNGDLTVQDVVFKATEREYNKLKKVRKTLKKKSGGNTQSKAQYKAGGKVVSLHSYVGTQKKEQKENTAHNTSDEVVNGISPTCTLDQNGFPSVKAIMRKRMYRQ